MHSIDQTMTYRTLFYLHSESIVFDETAPMITQAPVPRQTTIESGSPPTRGLIKSGRWRSFRSRVFVCDLSIKCLNPLS